MNTIPDGTRLDTLPAELLPLIAHNLPYSSYHSLSLSCKRFYTALSSPLVIKSLIISGSNGADVPDYQQSAIWTNVPITTSTPVELCKLYAMADYKAATMLNSESNFSMGGHPTGFTADFCSWAGILVALHHPIIYTLGRTPLQDPYARGESPRSGTQAYTTSFCLSAYLLCAPFSRRPLTAQSEPNSLAESNSTINIQKFYTRLRQTPISVLRTGQGDIIRAWEAIHEHRMALGHSLQENRRHGLVYAPPVEGSDPAAATSVLSFLELCVRTVGVLGYFRRQDRASVASLRGLEGEREVELGVEGWMGSRPELADLVPPTAWDIPFEELMEFPEMFNMRVATGSGEVGGGGGEDEEGGREGWGTAQRFPFCHLEKMTKRKFLTTGKWIGLIVKRTNGVLDVRNATVLADMKMKVAKRQHKFQRVNVVRFYGKGLAERMWFTFSLEMNTRTGHVKAETYYRIQHGRPVEFDGWMTPFGIVGDWGTIERWDPQNHAGVFWWWKEEWMQKT